MNELAKARRVLLVEDDRELAELVRMRLVVDGYETCDVSSVHGALEMIHADAFDGAILDIKLGDELVFPVAECLEQRNIPFVFASSYIDSVPHQHARRPFVRKPYLLNDLYRVLEEALSKPADRS